MARTRPTAKNSAAGTGLFEQPRYQPKNRSVLALMNEYGAKYEPLFNEVKTEWNLVIRDFYRNSMGLKLYSGPKGKKATGDGGVLIQIRPDRNDAFLKAVDEHLPDLDFERLAAMRQLAKALASVAPHYSADEERERVRSWLFNDTQAFIRGSSLASPFKAMLRTPGDHRSLFGQYTYSSQHIELFYMPLLIICKYREVDLRSSIVVVLAHELAHAYHHAGKDADGRTWVNMPKADIQIKEGLAQFYTERFVEAHEQHFPGLRKAYEAKHLGEDGPYNVHKAWRGMFTLEHMRLAMKITRRNAITSFEEFERTLLKAKDLLN